MAINAVTTVFYRTNQAKAQAGAEALKTVAKMSFGDGGADINGNPIPPLTTDTGLKNKLLAVAVEAVTYPVATTGRYTARLGLNDLVGKNISEIGLEDSLGNTLAIITFAPQPKSVENEFVFEWDEVY